jgi:glutathione peroxidase
VLISNIALECGTTPQLKGLEDLYREFNSRGLTVIGVPSNEFSGESVDDHSKIQTYCFKRFGVTFPLLAPGSLVGPNKRELFRFLTQQCAEELAGEVSFNLEKFLVDRHGNVRARFGPFANPMSQHVRSKVQQLLAEGGSTE